MRPRSRALILPALVFAALLASRDAGAVDTDPPGDVAGTYRHVGGDEDRRAVLAAIDRTVSKMNVLARPIARRRLRGANPVPSRIAISRLGGWYVVSIDGRRYEAPADGDAVRVKGVSGDDLELRCRLSEGRLEQHFQGARGGRTNSFAVAGALLELRVRVFSDRLPEDVEYTLRYARE